MRVLLTGGAGFIGLHVLNHLRHNGHEVRVLDSLRPDVHRERPDVSAELLVGDVRDREFVDRALAGIDAVCHLAAKVGLGVDMQDAPDYVSSNVGGTAVLLAAMSSAGIGRLTLAGSMVAYGEGQGLCPRHGMVRPGPRREVDLRAGRFDPPCSACGRTLLPALVGEQAPLDPRSIYAVSKVAQEHLATVWARDARSSATTLRYHNVYGPGMPRDTPYAGVAAIFLSALRRGQAPQVYEDGAQRRDFVHVRDVAAATVAAVESAPDGSRVFNIGSGTARTVGDLAAALSRSTAGPPPIITGRYRSGDVRHITADSALAMDELDWRPRVDFNAGIDELADAHPVTVP